MPQFEKIRLAISDEVCSLGRLSVHDVTTLVDAYDELVKALEVASNSCRDVTELGRFSPSVNPVRWVAQLKAHIDAAIAKGITAPTEEKAL